MYNSILILDDSLTQTKKDVIYALKKTNVLILEFNYASKNYEDLKTELNDIYQEREVLGDDLELQNILFLNTKFEHTNVFQSYLNNHKGFLLDIQINDPNYNSWTNLIDLIEHCKSSFSLEHFDILDINHLYYSESWSNVFQHIYSQCDLSNSFMKLNYLSKSIIMDETNTIALNSSNNWLKTLLNEFSDLNEDISNLMNLYFIKNNEESNNLLNSSTLFNIDSSATLCNNYSLNSYGSTIIKILIIPCLQQNNNETFALLIKQLNATSQSEILPIFLNDDESFESFSQKFVTLYNNFVSNIDTSNEYEIFMGIYLPPYWNDQPTPSNSISLSNQLQTISLELNNNQPSSGSIFSGIIQLIKTQYTYVSKLYFEFFNLTQNYSNNLNVIYKNLSTQEGFAGFVGFYFSYVTHLDQYHNIYKPEQDHIEIYNPYVNNMIYYDSGTTSYYYEESKHNIEYFLNLEKNKSFKTRDFIENVKIHNIILYNEELDGNLDEIQESLTPNTLLLEFSHDTTSYESMKQQLLSLNEESNVDIKNVALFQHAQEDSEQFIFLQDQDHTFFDVSNSDPELSTWSKFIDFTSFLQNDLHVSNFDLLMCQIYSDPNWVYILNKIESQLTSLNIRSSDDNTGHVMFDGDWVLESENVDVNMVYLYFNEKVLNVELVLVSGRNAIVMDNVNHKLYGAGEANSNTLGPGGTARDHFQEIPLPTVSSNIEANSGTAFASDEYIITYSISEKAHVIVTNKNRIFAIGANYGNMFTDDYTLDTIYSKWIELDTTFVGNANIIKIDVAASSNSTWGNHTMVLLDNGKLYACGYSWWSRNGNYYYFFPSSSQRVDSFTEVSLPANETKVVDFYEKTIYRQTVIKTNSGVVYQITGSSVSDWVVYIPSSIFNTGEYVANKHQLHNHLITSEGRFFFKGKNSHYRSGAESDIALDAEVSSWTLINLSNNVPYQYSSNEYPVDVYESTGAVLMLTNRNNIYTVGHNAQGMRAIGNTSTTNGTKINWVRITEDNNGNSLVGKVIKIHAAYQTSYIITSDGYVLGVGNNNRSGRLGINRAVNTAITKFERGRNSSNQELTVFTNFKGELLESSGSSSYNIPVISAFNTATDASSNTVLHFDSDSSYSDISYTLTTGIYKITNVPSNTPLALINNGQTDHIVYGGTTTESNSYGPNSSNYYNYVSGTMYIEVDSSFDPIGFYTTANSGSYLGTQGDLTYSAEAIEYSNISVDSTSASTNTLASSSYFNIFKDVSSNYFGILSDNNEISGNVYDNYKFINYNTYQITNIPEQYKLAIVEVSSNDVTITGDTNKKSSHNIDGVSHDFYYGDISINASYGFNTLKMYVYNGLKSSVVELENNITFELPNVSLVQNEASRKVLSKDVFLKVYKNSTTEYLIHFNENDELSGNFYDTYSIEDPGIYKFKSIPTRYLFGIKVNDNASSIEISGNDSNKSTYSAGGGNVDFYHGDLYVKINDLSYNISTYVYDTTTSTSVRVGSDSNEFIDFGNLGISGPTPVFMTLNVSEYFDTYGGFNVINIDPSFSSQPYDDSRDFGVYKNQTYVINAPTTYPLALVGRLDQSDISYSGYSENQDGTVSIGGTAYPLYHGPVFFTINDDLSANNTLSFYTKNQYNLNTTGSIVYDASSEFSLDLSINHYVENEDTYNIEMMNKVIVIQGGTTYTLNSGTRGHNANMTHRSTNNLTIEFSGKGGLCIGSPATGSGGKQYSQYFNSFVFMNSTQAGTWNFGLRTTDDNFASAYVLEGNYCWNSDMTYDSNTTSIITSSSPWTGTRYNDGVSYLSVNDFLSHVDTNYPDANITKIIEIPQSTTTQVNGQYTFEANKPYSFLIYWRHNTTATGTSNVSIRFGAWKEGTSSVSLPASGIATNINDYSSGDAVPEFFYRTINLSSTTTPGSSSNQLVSRFVTPNKINKNTTFYKNEKLVVYKNGVYNINQIPSWYPITILNNGITDKITLSGNANKKITQDVSGTSYDFYYGDISFSVLDSISDLSGVTLYSSYDGGSLVNNEYMIMMKEDSSLNEPLQQIMSMKVYTNGNGDPIYQLNDKSAIMSNYKFGAHVGTYIIKDVPEAYSMAVINNDISDVVTYSGTSTKGNYSGPDSIQYPFYYGTVTMTIKAFNEDIDGSYISLYSYNNGYMGAQNIIEISSNQVYNVMDQDLYLHGAGSSSVVTSITLEESETAMLQTEFIATTENATVSTWSANYVKENSNGSTSLTNSNTMFEYNSDTNGPYFLVNNNSSAVTLQNYPNQSYLFNMDSTSGAVLCYEMWCYYSGDDGTMTNGWVMGVETGWGPYLMLNVGGGISASPNATDGNNYSSLTNPGYITDNANKGQLLHIVTYWKQMSSSNHARGVYINGTHYPQETTSQSGRSNYPGFDSINSGRYFQIGGSSTGGNHAIGLRIYSFRIWHGDIRNKVSTLYDGGPHANVNTGSSSSSSSSSSSPSLTYFTPLSYQKDSSNITIENPTTYQNIDVSTTKYSYFTEKLPTSTSSSTYTDGSGCKTIMLNGETSYDANKVYSVYDGTYTISATSANAFAIINTDSSGTHPLVITGGTLETTKNSLYNTEISYNYYSGDVTFKVLGYFNNIVLIEHIDGSSNSQYTRIKYDETSNPSVYTESSGGGGEGSTTTTECLDISSSISVADGKYILNGNTSYDSNIRFGVYIGSYEIHNIPSGHPLAILNNDASNNVTYSGTTLEGTQEVNGVTYSYYSGKITLNIEDDFTNELNALSLHCLNHGYMGGQNIIVYSSDCSNQTPGYYVDCLDVSNSINVINQGGNKYVLNNGTAYETNRKFGVYIGNYEIHNIPTSHPMAILNNDVSNNVIYSGSTLNSTQEVNGISYNFYTGTMEITIIDDFTTDASALSLYCLNHGYMGGQDKIIYSSLCSDETPGYYVKCLDISSNVNVIDQSGNKYLFNNNTSYDAEQKIGLSTGVYTLNNVSSSHPIAFLNSGISNLVTYTGTTVEGTSQLNNVTYTFYSGTITLTINGDFSSTSTFLSAYCLNHGYMGAQDKFIYSSLCDGIPNTINKTCLQTNTKFNMIYNDNGELDPILNYTTDSSYNSTLQYGIDIGNYLITNISSRYPIAIINNDVSDSVYYSGEVLEITKRNTIDGIEYNYYSGYLKIDISAIPTNINQISYSVYNKTTHTSRNEKNKLVFDQECSTDDYYYDCLTTYSDIAYSNNKILLNENDYQSGSKKLGVYDGFYQINNVPKTNPIALVSTNNSSKVSYNGLEINKEEYTIDGQAIDFYYGNVIINIKGDFNNDLKLYMLRTDSTTSVAEVNLYYTDYCDYEGAIYDLNPSIVCMDLNNSMQIKLVNNKFQILLNGDTNYDSTVIYGFNIGLYRLPNVTIQNAIRISNTNINSGDVYLSSLNDLTTEYTKNDISNNYYYGNVYLHVTADVSYMDTGLIFDFANENDINNEDRILYSSTCFNENSYYLNCLDLSNNVNIVNDGGNKFVFNNGSSYSSATKFGLYYGNYSINNIPSEHPMAILNNDVSNNVTYGGSNLYGTKDISGVTYNFYTGTIYMTVKGNFNNDVSGLSVYCYNHGYMGGENIFKFNEVCSDETNGFYVENMDNSMEFRLVNGKLLLNDDTIYDNNGKHGIFVGTYTINNVPSTSPIAFMNSGLENKVAYTGTEIGGISQVNDISYTFYYGTVSLYVFEPFTGGTYSDAYDQYLSYSVLNNGYSGGENKLVYYDQNKSYSGFNYTICLNEQSISKIYDSDGNKITFNNSGNYFGYKKYGLHIGRYRLLDVQLLEPIAILNNDVSNVIQYSGDNLVTGTGPSGESVNFYYGNVDIQVTGDFGTVSLYSSNGSYVGGQNLLTFTDFCETNGFVIECLSLDSSMNIYGGKFSLNNHSSYNEFIRYGLTIGSYRITNIPNNQALTFINNDLSDSVIVTGDAIDLCGNFQGPDGNNYNFYTNEINLTIKKQFTGGLSLYSYSDLSYNNGEDLFRFSDLCTDVNFEQNFTHCLDNSGENDISLSQLDNSFIILDSTLINHNTSQKCGVYIGNYIFNVPESHPIAFLNKNKENLISYYGNNANALIGSGPPGNEGPYTFYHGRVILNVIGDFDTLSYYIFEKGYMGGLNKLKYTDFCNDGVTTQSISCLKLTSSFNLINSSNYTLNGDSQVKQNRLYGLHDGIYELNDICDNYPIAILNNSVEEFIDYVGDSSDLCGNFTAGDGNSYNFYKNKITVYVNGNFSSSQNISIYTKGSSDGYFGLQNKIVYSDLCIDTVTSEDEVINDDIENVSFSDLQS